MYFTFYLLFASFISLARAFFLFGGQEPLLFCVKVCPLYCSPRRSDEVVFAELFKSVMTCMLSDASSLIYVDEPPLHLGYGSWRHEIPYHFDPYFFCKPPKPTTTTTTTPAPTTTTEEPSYICMVCMKKCSKII